MKQSFVTFRKKMQVLFWFRKANHSKGTIYMRVVIDEVRAEYSTGIKIQQSVWQNRDLLFYNTPDFAKQVERLSMLEKRAYEIADLLYRAKRPQTSAIVLHVLEGVKHIPFKQDLFIDDINEVFAEKRLDFTLLQAFDFFTKEVALGDSRANSFRSFRLNTELYLKSIRLADMPAEKFGNEHGRNMFKLLCKTDGGPMLSERYAVNNVYGIRQILEYCVCEGKIENNPLSGFKMKTTVEDTHIHVTRLQLQKMRLMQVGVDLPKELEGVRDLFVLMCYTSMHYGDITSLKSEHLKFIDGEVFLIKKRKKNKFEYTQKVHPGAYQIINKYGSRPENLPQFKNNTEFNRLLAKLCKLLGIEENITSKAGRKTYVEMAYNVWEHDEVSIYMAMGLAGAEHIRKYGKARLERIQKTVNWEKYGK